VRDRLTFFWNLRHSSNHKIQVGWHLLVLALCTVILGVPWLRNGFFGLIVILGDLLCGVAGVWGIFHPRSVLPVRRAVWRWAVGVAVLITLGGWAFASDFTTNLAASLPTAGMLSATVIVLPFLLGLLMLYGWLGAAVSAYVARRWQDRERLTGVGVTIWWLLSVACLVAAAASYEMSPARKAADLNLVYNFVVSIPLLTALACRLARNPEWELRRFAERLLHRLTRYLTFRRRWRGRTFTVDLRGALLGFLVASVVFGLSRPLLKAPRASLLVWMIQVRNQEARGAWNSPRPDDLETWFASPLRRQDEGILTLRRKIVLIDLDTPVLRAAFAPSAASSSQPPVNEFDLPSVHSEAALQALLIRRLRSLRAAVIVLTPPQEQPEAPSESKDGQESETAKTTQAGRERSRKDETLLTDAIRKAGNIVLALPGRSSTQRRSEGPFAALSSAAAEAGDEGLVSYGSLRLPVLASGDDGRATSLPILIARLYARYARIQGTFAFKKNRLIPVDFRNAKPGHDFLHVTASSLLIPEQAGKPVANLILTPRGEWRSLEESIHGRVVFLDSPSPHFHETPVGSLPAREVLAYGTATVLAHQHGLRVAASRSLLLTLLIGTVMGMLCAHRTPFEAAGRMILMSCLVLFTSLACYMYWTLWFDAVVPLVAILLTYLLVTQLAFTQQREKDRDLLKRFVAPEFVDAMLDHPSDRLGLEGKLSHVCVLFADVRNFTGFAERHRPEEVFAAVNEYMTALTNALHAYGGVLDKYTGDGLMAWFPSDPNSQRQIEKAVRGTLAMRDAALEISKARTEHGKPALHFGIGMHYGEAMIGLVGNEEHQINYTALGHAVIVSARLQTLAAGGEVIISEAVYAALDETFQVEAREPVAVKGIYELVHPYHVLSA